MVDWYVVAFKSPVCLFMSSSTNFDHRLFVGPGIYHGTLSFPPPSSDHLHPGDGIIESASLVPYPSESSSPTHISSSFQERDREGEEGRTEMPISMALTEWHFVLLYGDKIRVIELLSDKVVYEESLDLVSEE